MWKEFLCFAFVCFVNGLPSEYTSKSFNIGIEYEHSLPMSAGADRYRHRNNYDPFFVTVTATAKKGYVLDYLEVTATTDVSGEVDFCLVQGKVGSRLMVFQLSSNHSDFLAYSYRAYGIREEEYNKITNVIFIPLPVPGRSAHIHLMSWLHLLITVYLLKIFQ